MQARTNYFWTKKIQLVLILTLIKLCAFSQPDYRKGYVQINEHDTIFGLINYKNDISNHKSCFFKKVENDVAQIFLPGKIFGYKFIDDKYYVSKEITTKNGPKTIFVEYLLKGSVNLFFYRDNSDHYLIQRNDMPIKEISYDDEIIYIDDKPYFREYLINRGLTKYYLHDCPELIGDIDKIKKPSHSGLIKLIKSYHEIKCPNDVCIIYKRKLPKFRIDVQPVFGTTNVGKGLTGDIYSNTEYTKHFGLLTYIWMPLTDEKIFFRSGLFYFSVKELDSVNHDQNGNPYGFVYGYYDYYKIPLQFQYISLKHTISPTFGAGLNVLVDHKSFSNYLALNVGLNVKLNDKSYISLYADMDYYGRYYIIPEYIVSNSFSLGFTIKL